MINSCKCCPRKFIHCKDLEFRFLGSNKRITFFELNQDINDLIFHILNKESKNWKCPQKGSLHDVPFIFSAFLNGSSKCLLLLL